MIRTTPFHARTAALNETQLWSHWSGHLAADRYQMSDKFEYFAVRNAAGIFDSSPLYKYRITGKDAERFLSGSSPATSAPARRATRSTRAGSTIAASSSRTGSSCTPAMTSTSSRRPSPTSRTSPTGSSATWTSRSRTSATDIGTLALQGPRSRALLARLVPQMEHIPYFGVAHGEIGGAAVTVSRTGYSGDLGYEIWTDTPDALHVWDTLWDSVEGHGVLPFGLAALYMLRIEAGLLLLDADFDSSRFAWNDAHRSTPIELGWGWMFKDLGTDGRAFIGRRALEREIADKTSRWAMRGLLVDWQDYDRVYNEAGLIPPEGPLADRRGLDAL